MPRPRFTLRWMMVAVAVSALMLGCWAVIVRRRDRFESLASFHRGMTGPMTIRTFAPEAPIFETATGRWHYELARKYDNAARYPWLPVSPDPPEPE